MKDANSAKDTKQAVLKIIQDINSGARDPSLLDKATRQQCVEVLIVEGYTYSQLAQLLKCSEKTISRDMQQVRKNNALTPSAGFVKEAVGELVIRARQHASYLMRLARDRGASSANKAAAEFLAWRVYKELAEKLQTLGYLPSKAQAIVGDFYHHIDDRIVDSISAQVVEMEEMIEQAGEVPASVQEEIKKAKTLAHKMIAAKTKPKEDKNEAK